MVASYFRALEVYPFNTVAKAVTLAADPGFYPDWFPTAGQVKRICEHVARERAVEAAREQEHRAHESEDAAIREHYKRIPVTMQGMESYIREAGGPLERLARIWECETKQSHRDPCASVPKAVGEKRTAQFWDTWEKATSTIAA